MLMGTIKFNNNDLSFDVDKILSFDKPIAIDKNIDYSLDFPFILDIGDGSYFYSEESERDQDFDKIYSLINIQPTTYYRPKTRGELVEKLKEGIKCEVVGSNEEFTNTCLDCFLKYEGNYITYPSENKGWVVYETK